jgi:hypothetical protein
MARLVLLFSQNHVGKYAKYVTKSLPSLNYLIDYPVAIWAVHRLGGVISYV